MDLGLFGSSRQELATKPKVQVMMKAYWCFFIGLASLKCEAVTNGQAFNATPTKLMNCPGAIEVTECMTSSQYDAIVLQVRETLESLPSTCTASDCPQADWAGCVLRMAGHDFMDYADGQGGADACTDMEDPENAGLPACLAAGEHGASLLQVYQQFCTEVRGLGVGSSQRDQKTEDVAHSCIQDHTYRYQEKTGHIRKTYHE